MREAWEQSTDRQRNCPDSDSAAPPGQPGALSGEPRPLLDTSVPVGSVSATPRPERAPGIQDLFSEHEAVGANEIADGPVGFAGR